MNQLTFIDKIQVLFKLLVSSPIIIGIFAFSMVLMIILFFYSKINKKIIKFIFIGIYVLILGFTVVKYGNYFLTSIDSFITIFMANIYFPMIPVYALIMLISFVIMIITLSSKKKYKLVKIINTVFFTLIQMLFALFIYIVESNNIDLSNNTAIYTNEQTLTLLELGMGLFVVWMVILLVILYLKKADKIFRVKSDYVQDDFDEYINDYNEPIKDVKNSNTKPINKKKIFSKKPISENDTVNYKSINEKNSFNNSIVDSLVPEMSLFSSNTEEVLSFDEDASSINDSNAASTLVGHNNNMIGNTYTNSVDFISSANNNNQTNINSADSIFNSFDFLDVSNNNERKNNDIEIIDLDI